VSVRRPTALLLALAVTVLAPAGCGGGSSNPPQGPTGVLTTDGIGPVHEGMSRAEVRSRFGPPDHSSIGPGCELTPNASQAISWTYRANRGRADLIFDAASDRFGYYRVATPAIATARGDRVGEPLGPLRRHWGGSLRHLNFGYPASPGAGIWQVRNGPTSELTFELRHGRIAAISGGDVQICE
jgi:hypothetical protein